MNLIAWTIIACEIGFWVVIIAGLTTRYVLHKQRLGLFFLALTPVIDLVLLTVTAIDLYHGATATFAHSLAAVYLGVSIVFGKSMIRWADDKFKYYIKKEGKKPVRKTGYAYARHSMKGSLQHVVAYAIGTALLAAMIYIVNDTSKTEELMAMLKVWTIAVAIDVIISISYFVWPPTKDKA